LKEIASQYAIPSGDGSKLPLAVDCNYKGNIVLPYKAFNSISDLQLALQPYGLTVEKSEREIEMFVFREKNK